MRYYFDMNHVDAVTAFLQSELKQDIYNVQFLERFRCRDILIEVDVGLGQYFDF